MKCPNIVTWMDHVGKQMLYFVTGTDYFSLQGRAKTCLQIPLLKSAEVGFEQITISKKADYDILFYLASHFTAAFVVLVRAGMHYTSPKADLRDQWCRDNLERVLCIFHLQFIPVCRLDYAKADP